MGYLEAASDTVASLEAENLKIKDGAKPSKSVIDDAYAKVDAESQSSTNDK